MRLFTLLVLLSCTASQSESQLAPLLPQSLDPMHTFGCRTVCGLYAPLTRGCEAMQKQEDAILTAYEKHTHWKRAKMCRALRGWGVYVAPDANKDGAWSAYREGIREDDRLLGLTLPDERGIIVGTDDWPHSALAHEVGHVFEVVIDHIEGGHERWTAKGICPAINEASILGDDCTEYQ